MKMYALRSFASSGRVVAVNRLSANTNEEALSIARGMVEGTSAVAGFDAWQGERRIKGVAPTMRERKNPRR